MTTLDQAFIRAFNRQSPFPLAVSPRPAAPQNERLARPLVAGAAESPTPSPEPPVPTPVGAAVELPPAQQEFKPAWQVDHFTWPKVCRRLIARAAEELDRLADALLAAGTSGQKVLAIAGCRRGEGATTLLLCAARRLAERGIKPLLVDADLARPRVAKRLGVQLQHGWNDGAEQECGSPDRAIVESVANNLAILPARQPAAEGGPSVGDPSQLAPCLTMLRNHYDMVLVDLGPLENTAAATQTLAGAIDAVVLVHNRYVTSDEQLLAFEEQLAAAGIPAAGIVENFVAEE